MRRSGVHVTGPASSSIRSMRASARNPAVSGTSIAVRTYARWAAGSTHRLLRPHPAPRRCALPSPGAPSPRVPRVRPARAGGLAAGAALHPLDGLQPRARERVRWRSSAYRTAVSSNDSPRCSGIWTASGPAMVCAMNTTLAQAGGGTIHGGGASSACGRMDARVGARGGMSSGSWVAGVGSGQPPYPGNPHMSHLGCVGGALIFTADFLRCGWPMRTRRLGAWAGTAAAGGTPWPQGLSSPGSRTNGCRRSSRKRAVRRRPGPHRGQVRRRARPRSALRQDLGGALAARSGGRGGALRDHRRGARPQAGRSRSRSTRSAWPTARTSSGISRCSPTVLGAIEQVCELWRGDVGAGTSCPARPSPPAALVEPSRDWLISAPDSQVARAAGAPVGLSDVAAVRAMTQALADLDHQYGSGHVRPVVVHYLNSVVSGLLAGSYREGVGRELFSAVSRLTELAAADVAIDAGKPALGVHPRRCGSPRRPGTGDTAGTCWPRP